MRLKDKVAIVTGAATGIGQGIALAFAKEGAKVVVDYFGKPEVSEDTLKQIAGLGGDAIGVDADVSSPTDVASLIKQTVDKSGNLDIIVNNADCLRRFPRGGFPENPHRQPVRDVPWGAGCRQTDDRAGQGRAHHQYLFRP